MVLGFGVASNAAEVGESSRAETVVDANVLEISLLEPVLPMINGKGPTEFLS